ncbi:gnl [Symbiodinium sp. KB8]|nr:gnl [Symbiodinium sp. KB8]
MAAESLHAGKGVCCPAYNADGALHVASHGTGSILSVSGSDCTELVNTGGQPAGLAWKEGELYVADQALAAILVVDSDGHHSVHVEDYEGKPFKGPHSITFDSEGTMYFTDPGPLGESTLANPVGSLFTIRSDGLLRPLALECLAHPTGIAVSPGDKAVYVAETMANRILRLVADPSGVFHTSVFASFSGRLGPVALACDHERGGVLYVGHFDFEGCSSGGLVSVLSPEGKLLMELFVASPEVSGLAISHDGQSLVVTDSGKSDLYYVAWGAAFLFVFGVPMYLVYLLKEDTEVRLLLGEHAPALVEAVQGFIDIDEVCVPARGRGWHVTSRSFSYSLHATTDPLEPQRIPPPTAVLQVSEEGLAQLQAALGQLEASEQELVRTTDPTSPDCTAPQVEQDMLPTRLQHLRNQQAMLAAQIEAGEAQLRALNKKWYHLW